jgi:hypothetical protein
MPPLFATPDLGANDPARPAEALATMITPHHRTLRQLRSAP